MIKLGWLLAATAALFAGSASAQIVTNGDFEAGNTGFNSDYSYVGTPGPTAMYPEGTYTVGTNAADYHNLWASVAAYSGDNYLIANGAPGPNVSVWSQMLTGLTVGQTYNFSAYITNVCCNGDFTGTNGTPFIVATDNGAFTVSGAAGATGVWTQLTGSFVATSTSTMLNIFNDNSMASGNDFGLDAISVTAAVPEPATWGLMILGFGAVGATLRRRSTKVAFAA